MKKVLVLLVVMSFTVVMFATGDAGKEMEKSHEKPQDHVCYKSVVMQINAFAKQEKYDEAMNLLVKAKDNPNYEGHVEHIYTTMAFINDKTKKYEENIKVWNEGLGKGVAFPINPTQDEYKPYLKLKGFYEVAKKNAEFKKKGVKAKAECDDNKTSEKAKADCDDKKKGDVGCEEKKGAK
ncbi:MAG: hypothetical protein PF638_02925 [Candidatus Delongbacteria bacterium]|jgi:hypothetical protein|nr:hypothetical protein [Candidatus Delongbacteria bacterium]